MNDIERDRSDEELRAIRKKYGATGDILEAEKRTPEQRLQELRDSLSYTSVYPNPCRTTGEIIVRIDGYLTKAHAAALMKYFEDE